MTAPADAADDSGSLAAGTNDDNDDSEQSDGSGPAFPWDFEPDDEEPQQPRW